MKFYYNGNLVRTSKTRIYTHAVILNGKCFACSGSRILAEKAMQTEINRYKILISNCEAAIKAVNEGKKYYYSIFHGKEYKNNIPEDRENFLKQARNTLESNRNYISGDWQIVELTAED